MSLRLVSIVSGSTTSGSTGSAAASMTSSSGDTISGCRFAAEFVELGADTIGAADDSTNGWASVA